MGCPTRENSENESNIAIEEMNPIIMDQEAFIAGLAQYEMMVEQIERIEDMNKEDEFERMWLIELNNIQISSEEELQLLKVAFRIQYDHNFIVRREQCRLRVGEFRQQFRAMINN